jgi:hypothetical protein
MRHSAPRATNPSSIPQLPSICTLNRDEAMNTSRAVCASASSKRKTTWLYINAERCSGVALALQDLLLALLYQGHRAEQAGRQNGHGDDARNEIVEVAHLV